MKKKDAKSTRKPRPHVSRPKPDPKPGTTVPVDAGAEFLKALHLIVPSVRTVVVQSPDVSKNMLFLDLAKVCYITSKAGEESGGRQETMFVTLGGARYYNNQSLNDLETKLKEANPWFLRTHRFYLVNLANLRGFRYSSERDLLFTSIEEPLLNGVSSDYRDAFDAAMGI